MKFKVYFLILSGLFIISNLSAKKIPEWVASRPIDNNYYIGIGVASKAKKSSDHIQIAKDNALKNLASEITINISGEVLSNVIEKSGVLEEEIKSSIQTSTQAELEGFEIIDTFEDKANYWIYYRLLKEVYERKKREKIDKAVSLALDLFSEARENERNINIEKALLYYLQALKPLEKYIAEPLKTTIDGKEIFLTNEIYFSIRNVLSKIELKPSHNKIKAKINKPLEKPIEIMAEYGIDGSSKISNLPLKFYFIKGAGDLIENVRTNSSGIAKCEITKITSPDKLQMIKAELDISSFINRDSTSFIYQNILESFPIPDTKVILNAKGLTFYIESDETNFGNKLDALYIEPKLKEMLSNKGFSFIEDVAEADLMISIQAKSRKGSEMYDLFSAFADLTISVIDMSSGVEIYKNSYNNIKGIGADFNKAGLKALLNIADKMKEVIPEIEKKL